MNTSELRKILIDDLMALRSGTLTPREAHARAALVKPILETVKLEMLHKAMDAPNVPSIDLTKNDVKQIEHDDNNIVGLRKPA